MASITSLSNSSSISSIYGNRNVLSGLASGMDTESMIENAVSGIKLKIQNLQKRRTKIEWQQEAYRSIIDKAVNFNTKYTSYSSKTNLLSSSFFSNAVNTTTAGTYKDKVIASGKTSSDIKLNAVKQLATAASYTVSGLGGLFNGEVSSATAGESFDLTKDMQVSTVSGSLTFQYGGSNGTTFDIRFDELENLNEVEVLNADGTVNKDATNAEKLAQAINNKLSEISYSYTKNGFSETTTADKAVKAEVNAVGDIVFSDGLKNGNSITISSASGDIKEAFGLTGSDNKTLVKANRDLTKGVRPAEYLKDRELSITYNGSTKKISMSKILDGIDSSKGSNEQFKDAFQKELDDAFGKGKIEVSRDKDGKLSFTPTGEGDTITVGGSAVKALGFSAGDSNYINTSKKLSELLDDSLFKDENKLMGVGEIRKTASGWFDEKGNRVNEDGVRINSDGKEMYNFQINGANINVTKETTLENLMNTINSNAEAGVKVSYSKLTNEFKFTATETGANSKIEFGGLAKELFGDTGAASKAVTPATSAAELLGQDYDYGSEFSNFDMDVDGTTFSVHVDENSSIESIVNDLNDMLSVVGDLDNPKYKGVTASYDAGSGSFVFKKGDQVLESSAENSIAKDLTAKLSEAASQGRYTNGQDAIMDVEVNGKRFENFTRSSNTFDIDGLNITVKGEFTTGVDDKGNPEEAVTFNTTTDTDKIVDAIRDFVNDYNEMVTEIKNAYSTMPAQKSNGARYDPLTAEEEDSYSESELKAYNEKAKQGILFGDSTLSSMYSKLLSAIQPGGTDGQALRDIGIGTSYSSGLTTISLDEDKLRSALESDPDKVKNAFTKTQEGGSASNGLMQTMQNTLNSYVKTTGEPKGVLITRAGSIKAPTSLNSNSLKSQIDNIDNQIDRWQDKMSSQIDRYTTQFSRLEQLIAEMNSQASAMAGLMGGSSGY